MSGRSRSGSDRTGTGGSSGPREPVPPGPPTPPRILRRLLALALPRDDRRHVPQELDVLFGRRAARVGRLRAIGWYTLQLLSFAVRLRGERFAPTIATLGRTAAAAGVETRLAARRLRQRPAYAITAVLTLAVGVGGVATVYSAANWVLLRPVPGVTDPGSLVRLRLEQHDDDSVFAWPISQPDLDSLRAGTASLTAVAASSEDEIHVELDDGSLERLTAEMVTPEYFDVLGIAPAAGRTFIAAEHDGASGPAEVVISDRLWRRHGNRARSTIGSELRVNGRRFTVIGVAPRGFHGAQLPGNADAWFASSAIDVIRPGSGAAALDNRGWGVWGSGGQIFGRLEPGATAADVTAQAARVMERVRAEHGFHSFLANNFVFRVYTGLGLSPYVARQAETTLGIVAGASLLLLLLAVVNVTNLALARGAARRYDVATCRALGASRGRVAGGSLLEGLLIGAAGAGLGLLLCLGGIRAFQDAHLSSRSLGGSPGAALEGMTIDLRVAAAAMLIALVAAFVAAVAPSLAAARQHAMSSIRSGRHEERSAARLRSGLVAAQVALSAVLLVGAGLLTRTVINLRSVDLGFATERVLTFSVEPSLQGYDDAQIGALAQRLIQRLDREPGVEAAAIVQPALLQGWHITDALYRADGPDDAERAIMARFETSPPFLDVIGARLVAGRGFTDASAAAEEVLLSESAARAAFPATEPAEVVGRSVRRGPGGRESATIAGVVEDPRFVDVIEGRREILIRPWTGDFGVAHVTFYVRCAVPPTSLFPRVHEVVQEIAPDLPVFALQTLAQQVDRRLVMQRLLARLAGILAGTGLLLAAIGLYGVLGYTVAARTREIGVRGALGAGPARLMGAVIGSGLGLAAAGATVGLLVAAGLTRVIAARLYGVTPIDPLTYGGALLLLALVATAASWIPARRAVRVSPVDALRDG